MTDDALRRVDALVAIGLGLARSAPSGRVLLARIALAIDPAWIPHPWGNEIAAELRAARERAGEPLSAQQIDRALRDAWGASPREELDDLDCDPVAVTPTSQVHRGVLDGAPVAVKVLRPGLAASVRQDLALLDSLVAPLRAAFPAVDASAVVRECRERALDELDLEQEAGAQRRFHRALRGHPWLTVPAPVTRLARAGVLVSEWVDGVALWQAPDPDQAAARLVRFALGAAVAGVMHADLDPEDVRVLPDGRLAILDFGAWCEVDRERVAIASSAVDAFLAADGDAFADSVARLGWLPAGEAVTAREVIERALGELAGPGPVRLDREAVLAAGQRLRGLSAALRRLILAGTLPPQDLWPVRAVATLLGTIARVGATADWSGLMAESLRAGWSA